MAADSPTLADARDSSWRIARKNQGSGNMKGESQDFDFSLSKTAKGEEHQKCVVTNPFGEDTE